MLLFKHSKCILVPSILYGQLWFSVLTEWGFLKRRGIFPLDTFIKHGQIQYIVPHFLLHISSFVSLRRARDEDKQGDQRVNDSRDAKNRLQFLRNEEKIIK